jgi:D-alanyl-D-alanine carboxypeptidase/D-alanyl-D-alanine-endopeptidase (penicillin-binding protein 4)
MALRAVAASLLAVVLAMGGPALARTSLTAPQPTPRAGAQVATASAGSLFFASPAAAAVRPEAVQPAAPITVPRTLTGPFGYILIDLGSGAVLDAHRPDEPLSPASVAKIPTALYALDHLGPEHRFETTLRATGPVRDGVLRGDLVLQGGGDPELDSDALGDLAAQLAGRVSRVDGALRVSHGNWPVAGLIDAEQPDRASYNPAVGGLNLNFNRVRLAWQREQGRLSAGLEAHAAQSSPRVQTVALTLEGEDCGCPPFALETLSGTAPAEHWRVRQALLKGDGAVWLPVRRPDLYAGDVLRSAAGSHGLTLPPPTPATATADTVLATHRSAPVGQIVANMLRYSTNISAELLGIAATAKAGAVPTSLGASAAAMNAWASRYAGFAPGDAGFRLANHSGLSAASRVSPARMAALLRAAHDDAHLGPQLKALLRSYAYAPPPPRGSKAQVAAVAAKTGTMNFTRGLAGYITTPSGRQLAFAWFANDLARRQKGLDDEAPDPGARAWRNAAIETERKLIANWVARFD